MTVSRAAIPGGGPGRPSLAALFLSFAVNAAIFGMIPFLYSVDAEREPARNPVPLCPAPVNPENIQGLRSIPDSLREDMNRLPKLHMKPLTTPVQPENIRLDIPLRETMAAPFLSLASPPPMAAMAQHVQGLREFSVEEVDQAPEVIRQIEPVYPYSARMRGITGKVVVKFLVDTRGRVTRPAIMHAEPHGVFEESVLNAVRRWRFRPGSYEGRKVPVWVLVPFTFELER